MKAKYNRPDRPCTNKRDKQTKRMHQRTAMNGCDMHRYLEPMRQGSMT